MPADDAPGGAEVERHEYMRVCMGVPTRIVVYAADPEAAERSAAAAFARISGLDQVMSDYRRSSDLNALCERAGGPDSEVPADLAEILRLAARVSAASEGAFDVSVGPAVALWRQARKDNRLPDPAAVAAARGLIDWRAVVVDPTEPRVRLEKAGMRLDLGGIAKGYAAQRGVEVLRAHGFDRCMVALAGDIVAAGPPPGKTGWRVEVIGERSYDQPAPDRMIIELANAAVSTSGDAEQFVEIEGERYSHIVDPRTGLGMTAIRAVTVVAPTGEEADALATAGCLLGEERGREMLAGWPSRVGMVFEEGGERRVLDPHGVIRPMAR